MDSGACQKKAARSLTLKMKKKWQRPKRIKKTKPLWQRRIFWLFWLFSLFLGLITYFIVYSPLFWLEKISIFGINNALPSAIENSVWRQTDKRIIFPTKSIFLVNSKKLVKTILAENPLLEKVELKKILPGQIKIEIKERFEEAAIEEIGIFFSIDAHGVVFAKTAYPPLFSIGFTNQPPQIVLGRQMVAEEKMSAILSFKRIVKAETGINIVSAIIGEGEKITILTDEGWQVYFNWAGDLGWQISKLKTILSKQISEEERKNLEYVDLRFGNLAPYKYK